MKPESLLLPLAVAFTAIILAFGHVHAPAKPIAPWRSFVELVGPPDVIGDTAWTFGLDPALVRAVIKVESGGNPRLVSCRGAVGVMQLTHFITRRMENPFDYEENLYHGCMHLASCLYRAHGDIHAALRRYNSGNAGIGGWKYADAVIAEYRKESRCP